MSHVLALLTPQNQLVCETLLATGLRLGDVLEFRKEKVKRRFTVIERKTGKKRTVYLNARLLTKLKGDGRNGWCFPNARNPERHRTRSAVWRDVNRAAKALRYKGVSPHSARKCFAVEHYRKNGGDLAKTQAVLNHDRSVTTLLYALADKIK